MRKDDKVPAHVRYELMLRARKREAPSFFNSSVGRRTLFYGVLLALAVFALFGGTKLGDKAARAIRKGKIVTLYPAESAPDNLISLVAPQSRPALLNPPKMTVPYSVRDGMRAAVDLVQFRQDFACEPIFRYLSGSAHVRAGEVTAAESTPDAIELPYAEVLTQPDAFRGAYLRTSGRVLPESLTKFSWKDPNEVEHDIWFGLLVTDADATGIQFLSMEPIPEFNPRYAHKWTAEGIFVQLIRQRVKGDLVRDVPLLILTNSRTAPAGESAPAADGTQPAPVRVGNLQLLPMRSVEGPMSYLARLGIILVMLAVLTMIVILWRKRLSKPPTSKPPLSTHSKK